MKYADLAAELSASVVSAPIKTLYSGFSSEQRIVLESPFNSSAVISAGAGAGKTRVLVERACALIQAGVDPRSIAVVTFTKKAATEITERVHSRFGSKTKIPACATVHSMALSSLLAQGHTVSVIDPHALNVILESLQQELPEEWQEYSLAELLLELNRCREEEEYTSEAGLIALRFEELLAQEGKCDFTQLLAQAAASVSPRFKYILVDEAQDLSSLQLTVLRKLMLPGGRFWFIGDSDQAIYAFRGAKPDVLSELIPTVDHHFVLSTNFRSTPEVVAHANNVIRFNSNRIEVDWTANRTDAGLVEVCHFEHGDDEIIEAEKWLNTPGRAVLARTQATVQYLKEKGLPAYTVHESKGLEWEEVWIIGCEAALFPHPLGIRDEERRLFYVAMTRARKNLKMSYCGSRAMKQAKKKDARHPSVFLYETQALDKK